jgi:hypothetical protein
MTNSSIRVERRAGQRFPYFLPLSLRVSTLSLEAVGLTQDLSSRGVFFLTDAPLTEGLEIELTLQMPSEITLGESMRVRCRGHVLRVVKLPQEVSGTQGKIGVAVRLEGYEYLPAMSESSSFARVAALHAHHETVS